jgi:hypothetical protein
MRAVLAFLLLVLAGFAAALFYGVHWILHRQRRHEPPACRRAVSIPVPGYGLEFVREGDRVDLVTDEPVLQDALVLDVKRPPTMEAVGAAVLALSPEDAKSALAASDAKKVHLEVRPSPANK